MRWFRRLKTWQRVLLPLLIALLLLTIANDVFGWGWRWMSLTMSLATLATTVFVFRQMMRNAIAAENRSEDKPPVSGGESQAPED